MSKENFYLQRKVLGKIITEREELYKRIGTGEIDPLQGEKSAIKVGQTRERVFNNLAAKRVKLEKINEQILDDQADKYMSKYGTKWGELQEIRRLEELGYLSAGIRKLYEDKFENFCQRLENNKELCGVVNKMRNDPNVEVKKPLTGREELDNFINNLPDSRGINQYVNWVSSWKYRIGQQGSDSLYILFPQLLDKDTSIITSTLNLLARNRGGQRSIDSKQKLISESDRDLRSKWEVGKSKMKLILLMKKVIQEEISKNTSA